MSWIKESSRTGALEAFLKGGKVLVLTEFDDGSVAIQRLEELLPEDTRYLVDAVPAVENPEFKQAVEEMQNQAAAYEKPKVYCADKVVKELKKCKSGLMNWAEDEAYKMAIDHAIEIVEGGGVDETL